MVKMDNRLRTAGLGGIGTAITYEHKIKLRKIQKTIITKFKRAGTLIK